MGKKAKSYRGQRKHYNPCGCFHCTGTNKEDRRLIEEKRIDKETEEIINNVCLYNVSGSDFWDDNKVIDFVNWYIELHKLDFKYTLENRTIIESFKNGDDVVKWHCH